MQVRVVAGGNLAAAPANAARPRARIGVAAEKARGQVQGERRLAHRAGSDEHDCMRRPAEDHRSDLRECAGLAARTGVIHGWLGEQSGRSENRTAG
jgi:hypothetical protein